MSTYDDDFDALFDGVDAPRDLPPELRDGLLSVRADLDVHAAANAAAEPRPLPADLRDRLVAAGAAAPLPDLTRRRLLRRLGATAAPASQWTRATAAAVVVLLLAGGVAVATQAGRRGQPLDVGAPPSTTSTTAVAETTTTSGLASVAAAAPETTTTTARRPRSPKPASPPPREALVAASTCDDLLARYRTSALEAVTAYGVPGATSTRFAAAPTAAAATAEGDGGGAAGFSETNVQEAGVDEPDIIKTDGRRVFVLDHDDQGRQFLRTLVVEPAGVRIAASTSLPQGAMQLLLSGNRLLVIGSLSRAPDEPQPQSAPSGSGDSTSEPTTSAPVRYQPWTAIWTYDVADPANPRVIHERSVEGVFVDARFTAGVARIVVQTFAKGPVYDYPRDGSEAEQQRAAEENRRRVAASTLDDWLPVMVAEDRRGPEPVVTRTRVCDCDDSMRPQEFSGFGHLSVLSVDPAAPEAAEATSIQGGADIVYASASGLYATTTAWRDNEPVMSTDTRETFIHRFAIEDKAPARYEASGAVPGYALNQFSMSEHRGHFRIATTIMNGETSESMVTVLRQEANRLVQVGQVGGLGKGERIYAVRFIGDTGYVVTFRQVDPLYVLDLRDPATPKVTGELKITGYSAYLHPTDPGRLLGVGQEASEEGRRMGTQVSLFDVSDPAAPRRADQEALGVNSSSTAEFDHHAFLWWAPTRTVAIPVIEYDRNAEDGDQSSSSALILKADTDSLAVQGRISHAGHVGTWYEGMVQRTFVIGSGLYTLSNAGLLVSDIDTLAERQWVALA